MGTRKLGLSLGCLLGKLSVPLPSDPATGPSAPLRALKTPLPFHVPSILVGLKATNPVLEMRNLRLREIAACLRSDISPNMVSS